jgi:hypothetical protein
MKVTVSTKIPADTVDPGVIAVGTAKGDLATVPISE